uniref:Putative nucleoside ABC transporter, substrate-binding component n=1 Tax=uncultured bacterium contig00051 TaxID=1181535 RepID=A0A806KHN9_9BACT|nr:putative nucleoside ABC transporter, substrate-binding component [uncultured bacterium contig00051]
MKKILIFAGIISILLLCVSCQKKKADTTPASDTGVTVRLLTDATGIDDKSFNAAAWRGILDFYGDTWSNPRQKGRAYDWVTAQTQDMYIPNLMQATDEGYDLIIATGFTWDSAVDTVASGNPNQKYMIVDVDWLSSPNVMQAVYAEHEGSYLVGVAAALKAKEDNISNPRFGFIGGVPGAVITKFEVGYVQGILSVIPDAEIVDYYVNSWGEPALAKTQAMNWYDAGVYAIYSAAGGSGNGTIAQAKEYRNAGRNVWAIGVDSDQHEEGVFNNAGDSAVLTSMLKRVESSVVYALNAVKNNSFKGEIITFDLKADGVGYSTANPALSAAISSQLEIVKSQIINGDIKIAATLAEAALIPGFPQNLRAIDD